MKNKIIIILIAVSLIAAAIITTFFLATTEKDQEITEAVSETYEENSSATSVNEENETFVNEVVLTSVMMQITTTQPQTTATAPVKTTTITTTVRHNSVPVNEITDLETEIVKKINEYRSTLGLYPITLNKSLSNFSAIRAQEASVYWSHTRPDGRPFETVFVDYNTFTNTRVSEILAKVGAPDAERIVNGWKNSPDHNTVLITSIYDEIGIAVYETNGIVYAAVHTI